MTIEIHSPNLQISEQLFGVIRKKILALARLGENISRVEIFFAEHMEMPGKNKSCKIRLSIFGDSLFVQKLDNSFEQAALSAIKVLKRNLKKKLQKRNQIPEEVISTVEV